MFYFTEYRVDISERIESGKTIFLEDEFEAMNKANELHSYHFQVFDNNAKHIGYGVPK